MDTAMPLERDIVLSRIIDYDIFITKTLRPKIQSLQKVKVTYLLSVTHGSIYDNSSAYIFAIMIYPS